MKRFSVIVPIYNVENYLTECIESILSQTFSDFEIILVDDGSPDKSGEICDKYASFHSNINVIHKENGGLSDARNAGINAAQGEFLVFIDSDDFFDDDKFLEKLDKIIAKKDAEIVIYSMKHFKNNDRNYIPSRVIFDDPKWNSFGSFEETLIELLKENKLIISACSNAVKREIVLERQLFFKNGIVSEDIEWAMRLYSKEQKIAFLNEQPYIYRAGRVGSITSSMKEKNFNDLFDIIKNFADKFSGSNNNIEKLLLNYIAYQYVILCGILVRAKDTKFKNSLIKQMKNYKWLMNYDMCPKVKKAKSIYSFFGLRVMIKVMGLYVKYGR